MPTIDAMALQRAGVMEPGVEVRIRLARSSVQVTLMVGRDVMVIRFNRTSQQVSIERTSVTQFVTFVCGNCMSNKRALVLSPENNKFMCEKCAI